MKFCQNLARIIFEIKLLTSNLGFSNFGLQATVALGDVVEFEKLPPGTAAWLCTKDKYNLPMFSNVCQAETKAK
jgi:hypothetical protein